MVNFTVLTDISNVGEYISEEISKKLIPNLGSFLTQLGSLLVLILLVIIFGYKPIKKMITKRQDYIASSINEATQKNKEAELNLIQSNEKIIASKKEAESIINESKQKALEEHNKLIEETKLEIINLKKEAELDIKRSQEEALEEIRKEMVGVALNASSELLKRNVTNKDNEKLVDDFIRGIDA